MNDALVINKLSLRIGESQILSDIDLSLRQGEITSLIGRSGSGKSMTALAAMGLAPSTATISGEILIDGEDMLKASEKKRCSLRGRKVAMIFQEPMTALNPLQTIGVQVAEAFLTHEKLTRTQAWTKAQSTLAKTGLPAHEVSPNRYAHELSGGQRQRVVIAIAIAMKPMVLIADEPTTALDVTTQAEILDLLKNLAQLEGCALLLITHDLAVVSHVSDHIAVMKAGAIVEKSGADAFYSNSTSDLAKEFIPARITRNAPTQKLPEALLQAHSISCDYNNPRPSLFSKTSVFRAVDEVNFTIGKGENLGLVGESGCGKSTIAKALLGLHPISAGGVTIAGENFPNREHAAMRRVRRKIQIVFQDPYSSFNPRQRISTILTEPLHLLDEPMSPAQRHERAATLIESVGLSADALEKYPHAFSGGQRQRIAIARALATDPDLIVLDEATSALDIASRNHILELLQSLSDSRAISLLFITHDLSVVRDITDRVMIMKSGKIVETGETKRIFDAPKEDYTKRLIAAAPVIRWRDAVAAGESHV